jgi:hypothetical protein
MFSKQQCIDFIFSMIVEPEQEWRLNSIYIYSIQKFLFVNGIDIPLTKTLDYFINSDLNTIPVLEENTEYIDEHDFACLLELCDNYISKSVMIIIHAWRTKNKNKKCYIHNNNNVISNTEIQTNTQTVSCFVKVATPLIIDDEDVYELYKVYKYNKWIKLLPIEKTILFDNYNKKEYFIPIANVLLDNDTFTIGKKTGQKKRNTLIKFIPTISLDEFNEKTEWLYIFLINNRLVKIGGTRTGLKGRVSSYLCGHHIEERGKSGDCSKTNGFIYNTFEFYLNLGCKIEMLGCKLPKTEFTIYIFGKSTKITAQTYHAYESTFLEDYKKMYNDYPLLNDNCDPDYKD